MSPQRSRPPRRLLVAAIVSAAAVVIAGIIATAGGGGDRPARLDSGDPGDQQLSGITPGGEIGEALPDIELASFDGRSIRLRDYVGRPLVINFWAAWCPPCLEEMPDFEQVHRALGEEVTFVGIDRSFMLDEGRALAAETGVTYDLLHDEASGEAFNAFDGVAMPTTLFVDERGVVVDVRAGRISRAELEARIRSKLLSG